MEGGASAAPSGDAAASEGAPVSEGDNLTDTGDIPMPVAPFAVVSGRAHRVCRTQFGPNCYRPKHVRGDVLGGRNG
jgi:hypothetical protein